MYKRLLAIWVVIALSITACSLFTVGINAVKGSGNVMRETRDVSGFTGIAIKGSADVDVTFGDSELVVVEAEDNIIPLIETKMQNNQLVISTKPGTNLATTKPVQVHVTMKSLDMVSISGSGSVVAQDLNGDAVRVDLPGSGNITLSGTVNSINIKIGGSGNVICDQLKASTAVVEVSGSGNVNVYASSSLDARIPGSGNVQYSGNPAHINKTVTGSGNIYE